MWLRAWDAIRGASDVIGFAAAVTVLGIILYSSGASVYRDARRRGLRAGWILAAIMLTWPVGWLLYTLAAWRWPELHPREPVHGLDVATWFRACWVGLFWYAATFFGLIWVGLLVSVMAERWGEYARFGVCFTPWAISGLVTILSYKDHIRERSWRMPARVLAAASGTVGLWLLLAELPLWWEYGEFLFGETSWATFFPRLTISLALWVSGGGLALVLRAKRRGASSDETVPRTDGESAPATDDA